MATKSKEMLDYALEYAEAGIPVIPLHAVLKDGSCTCGMAKCPSPGKHPRTSHGLKDASRDPKTLRKWWGSKRWPGASIGGVGGEFLCLDIDAKSGGLETLKRLVEANTPLPDTAIAETGEYDGERGIHYWYRVPDGVQAATRSNVRQGIDIRCTRGYGVLPPSPHASGVDYSWLSGSLATAAECPEWVLDLVPEYVDEESTWSPDPHFRMSKQVKQFLKGDLSVELGEQREFLAAAARSVLTTGRSVELTSSLLWEGYDGGGGICNSDWREGEPWTVEDIYALVSDIYVKPPTSPLEKDFSDQDFSLDDGGNGERLAKSFPDGYAVYCPEFDKWYLWSEADKWFVSDDGSFMKRRQLDIALELGREAMNARTEGEQKALHQWSKTSRMLPRVNAAVDLGKLHLLVQQTQLDANANVFACANGVVDLRTGELRDETPEDLLTKRSGAVYDPDAKSTLFEKFLEQAVPDPEVREFLQLACGYSLTGSTEEHKFFYIYGRPATGKSTFLDMFGKVMGTYSKVTDTSTFMRQGSRASGGPTEDLARLAGVRLVMTHEVEENERMAAALIAQYTGGDKVAARFLHKGTFEYAPQFKLWIAANHRARVSGARSGIWRRMMVVPMDEVVEKKDRDPTLPRKLREPEAQSAVLAWAVEGAVKWFKNNKRGKEIKAPSAVEKEGEDYQKESDHIYTFIEDMINRTNKPADRVPKGEVYEAYQGWCEQEGRERKVTSHVLSRRLKDLGYLYKNMHVNGKTRPCWVGVRLKGPQVKGV